MKMLLASRAPRVVWTRAGELPPPGRVSAVLALLAVAAMAVACDIPTEAPQWEQRWMVPADRTTVGVEELLPERVWVTPDQSAFTVQVDPVSFHESLASLCTACAPLDGRLAPKPAFQGTFHESVDLPQDVEAVEVRRGRVVVVARNGFGFDPLRPPGGPSGTIALSLRSGGSHGALLDHLVIDGATTSFAPGSLLTRTLEYSGPVDGTLTVTVDVDSPAGSLDPSDRVMVTLADELEVTATPQLLEVTSAVIGVAGRRFDLIDIDLDVEDLDEELVERVSAGAFLLEIANPWSVAASFELTVSGPTMGSPITKIVGVPTAAAASVRVDFTPEELRAFLGEPDVTLSGEGTVAAGATPVTVAPRQVLIIQTRLDLVLRVG